MKRKTLGFVVGGLLLFGCCGGAASLATRDDDAPTRRPLAAADLPTADALGGTPSPLPSPKPRATSARPKPAAITHRPKPKPTRTTAPKPKPAHVYYANCTALRKDHPAGVPAGAPGYRAGLDRDRDAWACES